MSQVVITLKIMPKSPETNLNHIEKDGKITIKIDNEKVNIVKEHLIISRKVPSPYVESSFKSGFVYLNKEVDDDLEAEGFARELMRRVQALRKKAGLQKTDRISLFVKTDEELKNTLNTVIGTIKEKVGAEQMLISDQNPSKKHEFSSKEKVRENKFELFLEKV